MGFILLLYLLYCVIKLQALLTLIILKNRNV